MYCLSRPLVALTLSLAAATASPALAKDDDSAIQARLSRLEAQNAALIDYLRAHSNDPAAAALIARLQNTAVAPAPVPARAPELASAPDTSAASGEYAASPQAQAMDLIGTSSAYSAMMLSHTEWTNTKTMVLLQAEKAGEIAHRLTIGGDVIAMGDWEYSNTASKFGWLMRQPTANNQVGHHVSELAINSVQMSLTARANSFITAYAELLYNPETNFATGSNTVIGRNVVSVGRSFVTFGNLAKLPVYLSIGKLDVPFGQNDTVSPFSNSTSWHAFGGLANEAELGYFGHGFSVRAAAIEGGAQFRAVNTPVDGTNVPSLVNNYAFDANYTLDFSGASVKVGGSYERGSDYGSNYPIAHFTTAVITNPAFAAYGKIRYGRLLIMGDFGRTLQAWPGSATLNLPGFGPNPYGILPASKVTSRTLGARYNAPVTPTGIDLSFEFSNFTAGPSGTPWHRQNQWVLGLKHQFEPAVKVFAEGLHTQGYVPLNFMTGGNGGGACGANTCTVAITPPGVNPYASWSVSGAISNIAVFGVEAAF